MKEYIVSLPDGKQIKLKGKSYEDLLCEIDNFFEIFKNEVCYYLGSNDEYIIKKCEENDINFEKIK